MIQVEKLRRLFDICGTHREGVRVDQISVSGISQEVVVAKDRRLAKIHNVDR